MMPTDLPKVHAVEGIQFKVLAQVFPVLRHDALKPLSNAKLTIVLLEKSIAKGTILTPEAPPFVNDLDTMLDESVDAIRLLNNWFQDEGRSANILQILHECRKLAFSQLLLSGKKVQIDDFTHLRDVAHHTSRYVVMAWLIHAIQALPERGILHVTQDGPARFAASVLPPPDDDGRESRPDTTAPISLADVETVARFHNWEVEKNLDSWLLTLPSRNHS
jgi:hypothetical protein